MASEETPYMVADPQEDVDTDKDAIINKQKREIEELNKIIRGLSEQQ